MSLYLGSQRVAGHNETTTPEDISDKAVFFSDTNNSENSDNLGGGNRIF